jgi:ribonuclease Z
LSALVQARLVNEPFGDPGVILDFRFGRRSMLFDCGDLSGLSGRELLRVSHVFVSHAHVDHFAGFDLLLRVCLHRNSPLHFIGPAGFADRVAAKLGGYTWNLLGAHSPDFVVTASEYEREEVVRTAIFRSREAFRRRDFAPPTLPAGILLAEENFTIHAAILDHGTPCLAFALQERLRVNVWTEGLNTLGLAVGPWLNEAKRAARRGEPDAFAVAGPDGRSIPLGLLREHAFHIAPGQRIAYVTDAQATAANLDKAVDLARDADHLFIEAVYLDADRSIAEANHHLTARAAGKAARRAGVKRVTPFHFSARYLGREAELRGELDAAFAGAN